MVKWTSDCVVSYLAAWPAEPSAMYGVHFQCFETTFLHVVDITKWLQLTVTVACIPSTEVSFSIDWPVVSANHHVISYIGLDRNPQVISKCSIPVHVDTVVLHGRKVGLPKNISVILYLTG